MPDLYSYNWSDKSKSRVTLQDLKDRIAISINAGKEKIKNVDILDFTALKFAETAIWPYPVKKKNECNFVEFINQLFTTAASIKAIQYLEAEERFWEMRLGTTSGRDLTVYSDEEKKSPEIIAEIFAVTDPTSNSKLKDEIISLAKNNKAEGNCEKISRRIAFFILGKSSFENLDEKYESWTEYTPKGLNKKKIEISEQISRPQNNSKEARWKCVCENETIEIVCWSSENCLTDFDATGN